MISKETVIKLHEYMASCTGGSVGLRDAGLLESAINGAFASFGGEDLYKTREEKAARIGFSLISNHAFVDGNKRIGVFVMLTLLKLWGVDLTCTNEDVIELGIATASGRMKYEDVLSWINKFKK